MARGWTQGHLADKASITPTTMSNIMAGRCQNPKTMRKVADALGLDLAEMVVETEVHA